MCGRRGQEPVKPGATSKYFALGKCEIRISILRPGEFDNQRLSGSLIREWFEDQSFDTTGWYQPSWSPRPYECLSYTWESEATPCIIDLNGYPRAIGQNFYNALRRLRHISQDRRVWIDAICIDQNNDSEKTMQVKRMVDIYRRASQTVSWLGEDSEDLGGEMTFQFMRWMQGKWGEQPKNCGRTIEHHVHAFNALQRHLWAHPCAAFSMPKFKSFLSRRWFTRRWIIQEMRASSQIQLQCGVSEIEVRKATRPQAGWMRSRICSPGADVLLSPRDSRDV